jgi:hypothetical protein
MTSNEADVEPTEVGKWDPVLTRHVVDLLRPIAKL